MTEASPPEICVRPALPGEYEAVDNLTATIYVSEGYTPAGSVERIRTAADRAASGEVLVAADGRSGRILGSVTLLLAGGPYAQIAGPEEAEFRLLAVDPAVREHGVGEALVRACLDRAGAHGCRRVVLSTQPAMTAAHRLYERLGFQRVPARDRRRPRGVSMLVYALEL